MITAMDVKGNKYVIFSPVLAESLDDLHFLAVLPSFQHGIINVLIV